MLNQLRTSKAIVSPLIGQICSKLNNAGLKSELQKLGLIGPLGSESSPPAEHLSLSLPSANCQHQQEEQHNLESFFKPKAANRSRLAAAASALHATHVDASSSVDELETMRLEIHDEETGAIRLVVDVHVTVAASRCQWFMRAMSSGMQEAISRRCVLHERSAEAFHRHFLTYLYTGALNDDSASYSMDEIVDMLTIADKYECDSLKRLLEIKIIHLIRQHDDDNETTAEAEDEDTERTAADRNLVLVEYMQFSDQFKLAALTDTCLMLLLKNWTRRKKTRREHDLKLVRDTDAFKTLGEPLRARIERLLDDSHARAKFMSKYSLSSSSAQQQQQQQRQSNHNFNGNDFNQYALYHHQSSSSSPPPPPQLPLDNHSVETANDFGDGGGQTASGDDEEQPQQQSNRRTQANLAANRLTELLNLAHPLIVLDAHLLNDSLRQLREIVGADYNELSDEQLVKLLIRNDCDLNRVIPIILHLE